MCDEQELEQIQQAYTITINKYRPYLPTSTKPRKRGNDKRDVKQTMPNGVAITREM